MPCPNHPAITDWLQPCARCATPYCSNCLVLIGGLQTCANCKAETVRDVQSGVPQQGLELASIGMRFLALLVDSLIISIPAIALTCAGLAVLGGAGALSGDNAENVAAQFMGFAFQMGIGILVAAINVLYEGFMLSRDGQTLGKKLCGVKVVSADWTELTPRQAWLRAAMRGVFGLFCCAAWANLLAGCFTQERTAFHDMIAKTRVITWR